MDIQVNLMLNGKKVLRKLDGCLSYEQELTVFS